MSEFTAGFSARSHGVADALKAAFAPRVAAFACNERGYGRWQVSVRSSVRARMAMYTQIGGLGSRSREQRSGSCWPYFVAGMGCGVMGRLLWLES